ncbi:hypothetical protein KFK09_024773 [Dendrobium nobile]|uniref:Uncharacterized protein n=1 Tax=Dendrobium nobile TaxID=94219 RepID=A0A8T3AFT5_DENNO|nr:hypothetical protein KFK09_024773 [Dendrobium nobile]
MGRSVNLGSLIQLSWLLLHYRLGFQLIEDDSTVTRTFNLLLVAIGRACNPILCKFIFLRRQSSLSCTISIQLEAKFVVREGGKMPASVSIDDTESV